MLRSIAGAPALILLGQWHIDHGPLANTGAGPSGMIIIIPIGFHPEFREHLGECYARFDLLLCAGM